MRTLAGLFWTLLLVALAALALWLLGLDGLVRASIAAGHLLDWVMGGLCLFWLIVILKVPWDLYFEAHAVAFEIERAGERHIPVPEGRSAYVLRLRRRLGWLAVGAHVASAALVAALSYFSGGAVGYYFAGFYLVSTVFRPALAGYVYLSRKLGAIAEESRYPREDVVELRNRVKTLEDSMEYQRKWSEQEQEAREKEAQELRQGVHALGREFESSIGRLTDNQEVIKGIQAFVRLVTQSAQP